MFKKTYYAAVCLLFLMTVSGCALLVAGAAGGVGTSAWLGGKLSQEVNVSMDKGTLAAEKAMTALKLKVTKKTSKDEVVQLIGEYYDGRQIWIDIRRISTTSSRIEVRVGATGDKEAADKIMTKIQRYL